MPQRLYYRKFYKLDFHKNDAPTIEKSVFHAFRSKVCPNCSASFSIYTKKDGQHYVWDNPEKTGEPKLEMKAIWFFICYSCGWWQISKKAYIEDMGYIHDPYIYHSILERVEDNSDKAQIIALRKTLQENWEQRKDLAPGAAAELVRDIMKEHYNCDVIHTKSHVNTPDGGIDLLIGHDGNKILTGVQVKRRQNGEPEGISHVRDFVGALSIEGMKKGVFVTTAERFTPAVHKAQTKLYENSRIELELVDAARLLELLNATTPFDSPVLPLGLKEESYWLADDRYFTTLEALMGLPGNKL